MKHGLKLAACAVLLALAPACGGDGAGDESTQLNAAAEMLDNQTIDASADSLVANEGDEWTQAENGMTAEGDEASNAAEAGVEVNAQ